MHVTSGTTGEPVAVGFTQRRPRGQQRGGRRGVPDRRPAARRRGRPLPQLRALRGRDRRPHGAGGERRDGRAGGHRPVAAAARPDPAARASRRSSARSPSPPTSPAAPARPAWTRARWGCATSSPPASRAPAWPRVRAEIEGAWGADGGRHVRDERRVVDDGRRLRRGRGPAPDRGGPRRARAGGPGQRRRRSSSRTARAASWCGRTCAARPRRCCATARATSAACGPRPAPCGRSSPRIRIDGRRDDMLRVQAVNVYPQAIGAVLAGDPRLGRHCVVAEGDPVVPAAAACTWRRRRRWTSPA